MIFVVCILLIFNYPTTAAKRRVEDKIRRPATVPGFATALTCRGILVKLVICVSSGQLKIKIANLMQYAILAYFLPFSNTLSLENMIGNLIAPLTKLLYHIIGNSMSRGDLQNIMQWVWQDKSICLPQMNCQRLHIDGKKYSRNQSCHFFKNLQHVTFVHTDTIAAFISSGQCLENLFFHFKW